MENVTVSKILYEVIEKVCSEYCKFPEQYTKEYGDNEEAEDKLSAERCENCILNKL